MMQHIEKLRTMTKWCLVLMILNILIPVLLLMPLYLMMLAANIMTGQGATLLKGLWTSLFSDLMTLIGLGINAWILYFFWKRIPRKLDEMGRKLNHSSDRIRRMEKRLRKAGVDCEVPEELNEQQIRRKALADINVEWIRRTVRTVILWQVVCCILALIGSGSLLTLILNVAALVFTVYFSKVADEETRMLDMTVCGQEKRIRSMEIKFRNNNINMDEIIQ